MLQLVIFGSHEERLVVSQDSLISILAHLHYEYILQILNIRPYKMTEEIPDSKGDLFFCLVPTTQPVLAKKIIDPKY